MRRWFTSTVCTLISLHLVLLTSGAHAQVGVPVTDLRLTDTKSKSYSLVSESSQHKASVFLFYSSTCPISTGYSSRIEKLSQFAKSHQLGFFLVGETSNQNDKGLDVDLLARGITCPAIDDITHQLADALHASTTPEAVVLDSSAIVRYRGRIDDSSVEPNVVIRYVQDALNQLLLNHSPKVSRTLAQGCKIFRVPNSSASFSHNNLTYSSDVAPIFVRRCVTCHKIGEAAPFALTTYAEAKPWIFAIKEYTQRKLMPPWKADISVGSFQDCRALSAAEISTISDWVDGGAKFGLPINRPHISGAGSPEWTLGKPDKVFAPAKSFRISASGGDVYRNFVLPLNTDQVRHVKGIEFRPGNRAVVHHIVAYVDYTGQSELLEGRDGQPGYTSEGSAGIGFPFYQSLWMQGWVPGTRPRFLPKGIVHEIPVGARLVMQVHYHRTGRPETDKSSMALYFATQSESKQVLKTEAITNVSFKLLAGEANSEVQDHFTLREARTILSVQPHMHMLGREMEMSATLPSGENIPLILVNDWDFNWQETYWLKQPISLPTGTRIDLRAVFDNSEGNPRQPSHPPKTVRWGEQTTDEMCIGFFQYVLHANPQQPTHIR